MMLVKTGKLEYELHINKHSSTATLHLTLPKITACQYIQIAVHLNSESILGGGDVNDTNIK